MKIIYLFSFIIFYAGTIYAQVPVNEAENVSPSPLAPNSLPPENLPMAEDFADSALPLSPLSDPNELSLIEGLDEEFEVLKLRDQDTNMILDMIQ